MWPWAIWSLQRSAELTCELERRCPCSQVALHPNCAQFYGKAVREYKLGRFAERMDPFVSDGKMVEI